MTDPLIPPPLRHDGNASDNGACDRQMVAAELMGRHAHKTCDGITVNIWRRGQKFIARGSYQRRRFGETLGDNEDDATARFRALLMEIDNNAYVRPSEARNRTVKKNQNRRLTLRQIIDEFLADTRKLRGKQTARTYKSRLLPILDFAEIPKNRTRWPMAADIDREFMIELRRFLYQYSVTGNGRAGGQSKPMSSRTVINVLECFRTLLGWAKKADVRRLPVDWINPLTQEIIGVPPPKDPLRGDPIPLASRVKIVDVMDCWQLCHLSLSITLPLRPEEAAGLLISDVNFEENSLRIGTRLGGDDFTKARQSFTLPFAPELRSLLVACVNGRVEGPLLRCRKAFTGRRPSEVSSFEQLTQRYQQKLLQMTPESVQTEQDRKASFRSALRGMGGVATNQLAVEFKRLLAKAGIPKGPTLKSLRHSTTQGLKIAEISQKKHGLS